jgi:hypothetical protein
MNHMRDYEPMGCGGGTSLTHVFGRAGSLSRRCLITMTANASQSAIPIETLLVNSRIETVAPGFGSHTGLSKGEETQTLSNNGRNGLEF